MLTDTPKSGEVELHIAPRLAVASMASTARLELGRYPTTDGGGMSGCGQRKWVCPHLLPCLLTLPLPS